MSPRAQLPPCTSTIAGGGVGALTSAVVTSSGAGGVQTSSLCGIPASVRVGLVADDRDVGKRRKSGVVDLSARRDLSRFRRAPRRARAQRERGRAQDADDREGGSQGSGTHEDGA